MVERFHRTLKAALRAQKEDWLTALPMVMLALRYISGEAGFNPFTAVTGATIVSANYGKQKQSGI